MRQHGTRLKSARRAAGLTQAELARRSGLAPSNISAYEGGRRPMSESMLGRLLEQVRRRRPSEAVASARDEVVAVVSSHGGSDPAVFGSAARGQDTTESDLDLLVTMTPGSTLIDLLEMEQDLEQLLSVRVDVVSRGGLRGPDDPLVRDAMPL